MEVKIKHDKEHNKFITNINGREAHMRYEQVSPKKLDYYRTYVPKDLREQGIASHLVEEALNYAKKNDYEVIPSCSFVNGYVEKHQEYQGITTHEDA